MTYFGNANPDLLDIMPLTAGRVLELGCGEGALAEAYLRRNPRANYTAVEVHAPSAAVARDRVHRLIGEDFDTITDDDLASGSRFDLVALGDVLEHLSDPVGVLRRLETVLADNGHLAISIPNVSHWTAFAHLFHGRWPAEDAGLFDRTHLRFFTLDSMTQALDAAGFRVLKVKPRQFLLDKAAAERWIPPLADLAVTMGIDRNAFLRRASTLQYVFLAEKKARPRTQPLHLKTIAFAPRFMDVRTRLPAAQLASEPGLTIHYQGDNQEMPRLPRETPKILIAQRVLPTSDQSWPDQMARTIRDGWLVVSEWDDHPLLLRSARDDQQAASVRLSLVGSHAVQTSTSSLVEVFRTYNPEVTAFPNAAFDLPPLRPREGPPRIFFGALNRENFSATVAATLAPLLAKRTDLQLEVVHDRSFFDALPTENKQFYPSLPYEAYLQTLAGCNIALLPLEGTDPELFKSDLKYVECAAQGVAVIASPAVYGETIRNGENGLIASTLNQWPAALERLASDPALRDRIARAAWEDVRDNRMFAHQIAARTAWYHDLWSRRDALNAALFERQPAIAEAMRQLG